MSYPELPHTRAVSYEFLDHILEIFGTQIKNIKLGLEEEVLNTLLDFIGTPVDELATMEWIDDENNRHSLTKANIRLLRNMHAWILWEEKNRPGLDYKMTTMDDYDQFLKVRNQPSTIVTPISSAPPISTPLQVAIPTLPTTPTMAQYTSPSSFMPNVKLDAKYPVFNGDGSAWIKFK